MLGDTTFVLVVLVVGYPVEIGYDNFRLGHCGFLPDKESQAHLTAMPFSSLLLKDGVAFSQLVHLCSDVLIIRCLRYELCDAIQLLDLLLT